MTDALTRLQLEAFLPYRLSIASNLVSDVIARDYRQRFGIKIPEWRIMAVLGQGASVNQRDLVAATRMDKVTVSRATAALVARGLVQRAPTKRDGRSHLLSLSSAGLGLYAEIVPVALAMERRIVAALTDEEQSVLTGLLQRLEAAAACLKD